MVDLILTIVLSTNGTDYFIVIGAIPILRRFRGMFFSLSLSTRAKNQTITLID
jgi:hypothetical protein